MPLVRPAPLSAWMLAGLSGGVAPAGGDELLGRGRVRRGAPGRPGTAGSGHRRACLPQPNIIMTGTGPGRSPGSDERHLDVDVIAG